MDLLAKFLPQKEFKSYEDFCDNLKVEVPENFNFSWDVMDVLAQEKGNERAMLWYDEKGAEAQFTYADIKRLTNQAANALVAGGIRKGDPVMLVLKRRHEYWPILLALHKIGAVAIPATHLLTAKDIIYRIGAADIVGIICIDDPEFIRRVDESEAKIKDEAGGKCSLRFKAFVRYQHGKADDNTAGAANESWTDFNKVSVGSSG